ncbi:YHS domain-containing (seleno)protein [Pseudohalocynthiibacter aestuariivivens]|jgi:hypothetical protein|uniref:YHS domain-containing (Seleno)protein n=1 Tax=Pseudohalocynthiibacter aestuariivivens TaxID=1591409 RepID=A0ABV5JDH6_9RHOB|nr:MULTISPECIES: YHS domain-containing (seleno)protein [Pseudohalocynthiibacter]MBS9718946.1 YHS domain protein [Pseudohalocynthiibacter aestuariivivens]MCK0104397.1 YHS domain protein [Pseudohalocynthiibacter sp. F2068]
MTNRRAFLGLLVALPVVGTIVRPALASSPEVFATDGVAINGYDPVAYFSQSAPVLGDETHALIWRGATWYFSSANNMVRFEANPELFAPQYGGYCAFAVSKGATASTVPEAWTIHEEKLYLNYSLPVREIWRGDIPGNIGKADANWPGVLDT